jgi:hypothetical protein
MGERKVAGRWTASVEKDGGTERYTEGTRVGTEVTEMMEEEVVVRGGRSF